MEALAARPSGVAVGEPGAPTVPRPGHRAPGPGGVGARTRLQDPGAWKSGRPCPRGLSRPAPILGTAWPRTAPATWGNSKKKVFSHFP